MVSIATSDFNWGSIDEYNYVEFLDSQGNPIFFRDFGLVLSGEAVTAFLGVPLYSSVFVDFDFAGSPVPRKMRFRTTTTGIEIDNLAFAPAFVSNIIAGGQASITLPQSAVPAAVAAPASLGMLGLSVMALAALRHRRAR